VDTYLAKKPTETLEKEGHKKTSTLVITGKAFWRGGVMGVSFSFWENGDVLI